MNSLALESLKEIVDPSSLLRELGFRVYYDNQDEIRAACALHGGDNKTAFSFRKSSKRFYCFTHSCESDDGVVNNDIISLVMKAKRCSFAAAVRFLVSFTGYNIDLGSVDPEMEKKFFASKEKAKFVSGVLNSKLEVQELSEELVKQYRSVGADYFKNLGLPESIINDFELGTMVEEFGVDWSTIPIRDEFGRLVSISGRRTDGDEEPRYKLLKDFKKRRVLYNLHNARKHRDFCGGTVIVVEGFKALWHVVMSGYQNVVAVMGKVIRPEQRNLLVKSGFSCSILLLDGDDPGKDGMEKSVLLLRGKMEVKPIYLPQDVSPDDVPLDDLRSLIDMFLI